MRLCTEKLPVFKFTWHSWQALTWNRPVNQKLWKILCSTVLGNRKLVIFWVCWSCGTWDFKLVLVQAGDDGALQPVVPQSKVRPGGQWWSISALKRGLEHESSWCCLPGIFRNVLASGSSRTQCSPLCSADPRNLSSMASPWNFGVTIPGSVKKCVALRNTF